jgi:hypothetical protein
MKLLPFTPKELEPAATTGQQGKFIYDLYRQARGAQGWAELTWEHLSPPQRLVWARVTERLATMGGGV